MNHLIRLAKQAGTRPRVHGNGFVQLDLSPIMRLHIWGHPDIPHQDPPTPIHNHQFSFTSLVLRGSIMNQLYTINSNTDASHRVYRAKVREGEDTVLEPTQQRVRVIPVSRQVIPAGGFYNMERGAVHESIVSELTVTLITKSGPTLAQGGPIPSVYVPLDRKPDNTFNRYSIEPAHLWKIIFEALK